MKITIVVPTVAVHDTVIATIEAIEEPTFKFIGKKAINLEFECSGDDKNAACDIAKKALKKNPALMMATYSVATYM